MFEAFIESGERKTVGELAAYVFGARFVQFDPLTRQAFPVLRGVVDRSGFNATLSVLDNLKPLYLIGIAGPVPVDLSSNFGSYFPFHATAAGKVLATYTDASTRQKMLRAVPFERVTGRTITDPAAIEAELKLVFRQGTPPRTVSASRALAPGAMAVPVVGHDGELIAALGIAKIVDADDYDYEYQAAILKSSALTLAERLIGAPRLRTKLAQSPGHTHRAQIDAPMRVFPAYISDDLPTSRSKLSVRWIRWIKSASKIACLSSETGSSRVARRLGGLIPLACRRSSVAHPAPFPRRSSGLPSLQRLRDMHPQPMH
ncbi:Transcriptional regulator, IclR family [Candidatus Burkholderia brachyanthoides]|nr:Transcriptional regulator, IclR family [Candidatus Burkholderia brachyanthoides]